MSRQQFQPGELVDITIRGARVVEVCHHGFVDGHELKYEYVAPSGEAFPCGVIYDAPDVTVTRVAPVAWPPRPGDLWRSAPEQSAPRGWLWLAGDTTTDGGTTDPYVPLVDGNHVRRLHPDEVLHAYGPMTLVHRDEGLDPDLAPRPGVTQ